MTRSKTIFYNDCFKEQLEKVVSHAFTRDCFDRRANESLINQLLYVDTKSWLPDDLLIKADKMTMASSVELRVPLLDHKVLEFAANLPSTHKTTKLSTKRVLKKTLKNHVPKEILSRKKMGFPIPYGKWLRNDLADFVRDTLLSKDTQLDKYLSRRQVYNLIEEDKKGLGLSKEIFGLLVLELSLKKFSKY